MPLYLYIRFSSRRQKDGNSIRRQIDYGRAFCLRENIPFDPDSQTLCDEGTSGFRGKHRQEGRAGGLSEFLARCESGQITPGSYLLVESLDRLTREHPLDAMDLLRQLLREYGIVLVVMRPEMKLTSQSLGQLEGIIAFLEAMRAHGESARKSDMSRYNWEIKRAEASTKPVTARVPSWLTVEDGKIVPVKEKVKAVRRIFELARRGTGTR
ncbi:MAG: recombinase family protein [Gemmataceae bacterium]|nr:recombinase family protein [Gemmataceae bacterium]